MKICVITKCDDFLDDFIVLRGSQWRYYHGDRPEAKVFKPIKMPPFYKGEILLLDENDREFGPLLRAPYKWGCEGTFSQGKYLPPKVGRQWRLTEFVIVNSLDEAAILIKELGTEV